MYSEVVNGLHPSDPATQGHAQIPWAYWCHILWIDPGLGLLGHLAVPFLISWRTSISFSNLHFSQQYAQAPFVCAHTCFFSCFSDKHFNLEWCLLADIFKLSWYIQLWWCTPLIPPLRVQRRTDLCESEARTVYIQGYTVRHHLKNRQTKPIHFLYIKSRRALKDSFWS